MKSITLYTEEIDDLEEAMEDLKGQLAESGFTLLKNTCGISFCESDTEVEELAGLLAGTFDFPIMGGTTMAMLMKGNGFQACGISLMILTADDCAFHMGMTGGLPEDREQAAEAVRALYGEMSAGLPEREKLMYVLGTKIMGLGGEVYVDTLSEASPGVPVFGALTSDRLNFQSFKVFCKGRVERFGMALLLMTGEIRPIFRSEFSLNNRRNLSYKITSSQGAYVYELDGRPFLDVLKEIGLESRQEDTSFVGMEFIGTPFLTVEEKANGEKVQKMRNITAMYPEDRSGKFLGDMAEGATLQIGLIRKDDIQASVAKAFESVLAQLRESDYPYSTILCTSCGNRYLVLGTEPDLEARAFQSVLPDDIALLGFYSYGEIAPQIMESGNLYNCFLNDTFTIMAL